MVLQAGVAELVDRAGLAEHPAMVGIVEKGHQLPRQLTTHRKPCLHDGELTPGGAAEPEREPDCDPGRRSGREPDGEPGLQRGREPDGEPERESTRDPARYGYGSVTTED